ncbi:hypothetical protein BRADI_5g23345v3 [Brachypodium distachyon]|uniref:Uncharacterized protein n=1 Tax=Brachypodium distachyon TaxID=15368 RepID=A0A2K2CIU5_BRADI|nr:hypothetical protein BRADI_5g23345v3 [Brachypodium distachyon]PNT61951.1 hypothetical protein BRADI_5g23345v3 [Brachypodium distachyon]
MAMHHSLHRSPLNFFRAMSSGHLSLPLVTMMTTKKNGTSVGESTVKIQSNINGRAAGRVVVRQRNKAEHLR